MEYVYTRKTFVPVSFSIQNPCIAIVKADIYISQVYMYTDVCMHCHTLSHTVSIMLTKMSDTEQWKLTQDQSLSFHVRLLNEYTHQVAKDH